MRNQKSIIIIQCECGNQRQTTVKGKGSRIVLTGYRKCEECGKRIDLKKGFVRKI